MGSEAKTPAPAVDGECAARPAGTRAPQGSIRAAIIRELLSGPKTSPELDRALGLKASAHIRPTMEMGGVVYRVLSERTGRTCRYTLVTPDAEGDSAVRRTTPATPRERHD